MELEEIAKRVVDCGFGIHRDLGPGLLESAYEAIMARSLEKRGFYVERQKMVQIKYDGLELDEGFRADLLVDRQLLVELKAVERIAPVHGRQVLTYLQFLELPLGLLINFGAATFKEGVQRIVNGHTRFDASSLRIHQ